MDKNHNPFAMLDDEDDGGGGGGAGHAAGGAEVSGMGGGGQPVAVLAAAAVAMLALPTKLAVCCWDMDEGVASDGSKAAASPGSEGNAVRVEAGWVQHSAFSQATHLHLDPRRGCTRSLVERKALEYTGFPRARVCVCV